MRHALICSLAALGMAYAASAAANPNKLKGEYAFTGTAVCLTSPVGFNLATGTPLPGPVWSNSFSVEGVRTFNGDGTGTVTGTSVGITGPSFLYPGPSSVLAPFPLLNVGSNTFTASVSYTVNNDGTFDTQLVGPLLSTSLTPVPGNTSNVTVPPLTGVIGDDGKTLTLASIVPAVETVTPVTPPGSPVYRICHRSRVLVKIKG